MKIYLTAIVKVKAHYREAVLAVLQDMVVQTHKEAACELYNLHQDLNDPNTFVFYEVWKSQEGLDAHNEQPYIKAFGQLIAEKLQEPPLIWHTTML